MKIKTKVTPPVKRKKFRNKRDSINTYNNKKLKKENEIAKICLFRFQLSSNYLRILEYIKTKLKYDFCSVI